MGHQEAGGGPPSSFPFRFHHFQDQRVLREGRCRQGVGGGKRLGVWAHEAARRREDAMELPAWAWIRGRAPQGLEHKILEIPAPVSHAAP